LNDPEQINRRLFDAGIIGGYAFEDGLMFAFTEKRTRQQIDRLVDVIGGKA
jgi:glycine dehydrogenase subunit 1